VLRAAVRGLATAAQVKELSRRGVPKCDCRSKLSEPPHSVWVARGEEVLDAFADSAVMHYLLRVADEAARCACVRWHLRALQRDRAFLNVWRPGRGQAKHSDRGRLTVVLKLLARGGECGRLLAFLDGAALPLSVFEHGDNLAVMAPNLEHEVTDAGEGSFRVTLVVTYY